MLSLPRRLIVAGVTGTAARTIIAEWNLTRQGAKSNAVAVWEFLHTKGACFSFFVFFVSFVVKAPGARAELAYAQSRTPPGVGSGGTGRPVALTRFWF